MQCSQYVARVHIRIVASRGKATLRRGRVRTLLPHPHQLRIVTAATTVIDWQLALRA